MRIVLPLLLVLIYAAQAAAAQQFPESFSELRAPSLFRHVTYHYGDSASTAPVELHPTKQFRTSVPSVEPLERLAVLQGTRWKAGAVVGGIVGGAMGLTFGLIRENLINEGRWTVGSYSLRTMFLGVAGGALVGGRFGSMLRK